MQFSSPVFRIRRESVFVFACLAVFSGSGAYADEFTLSSGKVVQGAIQSETADRYVIQTEVGTINVPKSDVIRTVSTGGSALEVQGDMAAKKGDMASARTAWTQALANAQAGSDAHNRLSDKLSRLTAQSQQAAASEKASLLAQARTMLDNQQLDTAQTALDRLQSRLTESDDALSSQVRQLEAQIHYARGIAARDAVRLELAQQELEQAISADPSFYPAYLALGESLMGNSATVPRGTEVLEEGLRVAGNNISDAKRYETTYELAQRYFESRSYGRAARAFASLIPVREKYPAYTDALDRAVDAYVKSSEENLSTDFRQTITALNTALELNPRNEKALFLLGRIYLDMGQIENAVVTLERLVATNPTYPEGRLYLGRAYSQAHDYDNAVRHLSAAVALDGNSYRALVDRAEAEVNRGRYNSAETDLATARTIEPNNWLAYYLTGSLQYRQGNYQAAQESVQEALTRNRAAIPAHMLMGRILDARNQSQGARQWLEQVVSRLRQEPTLGYRYRLYLAEALTRLGEISIKEQSPRQAENYLKEALEVEPNYAPALVASADALLLQTVESFAPAPTDLYQRAESLYQRAITLEPKEADHYLKIARFYQQYLRDNEKARSNFNKYVDAGGRNLSVNTWLAEVGGKLRDEITSASASTLIAQPMMSAGMMTTGSVAMTAITTGTMATTQPAVSVMPAAVFTPGIMTPAVATPASDAMIMETTSTATGAATPMTMPAANPLPAPQ